MKAVRRHQGAEESKNNPQREVQEAVREIPIEKEKGEFSDVLAELEQILKDAKDGKRELPSLRAATFEATKHHQLSRDAAYNRLVINATRMDMQDSLAQRVKKLHDDWMAIRIELGQYHGGTRARKPGTANKDKPDDEQDLVRKFEASLWLKQRDWTREELSKMFSSDTGNMVWFNMRLTEDERKRLVVWLDANTTNEEHTRFHSAFIDKANKDYGMHWIKGKREEGPVKRKRAGRTGEKVYPLKSDWEEEEDE